MWLQLQADIFNRPIYRTETVEAAATGAAFLSGVGVGVYRDAHEAVRRAVHWRKAVIYPIPSNVERYAALYPAFCQLYPALAEYFHAL